MTDLDSFVEGHLNLQVKISYADHHDFLVRHGLNECSRVLDIGTGNGTFVSWLSRDYPYKKFVGIDKRRPCIESAQKLKSDNLEFEQVDMFSRTTQFDFGRFDGFLMRYFLLHVDHSQKILSLLKERSKKSSQFWIIDLDWTQITCEPPHGTFDKLVSLVKDFCSKISFGSMGGQKVVPLLESLGYEDIITENIPFSTKTIPLEELTQYLIQEIQCYSMMMGENPDEEIVRFLNEEVRSGRVAVSYGMVLVSAKV